MKKILLSIIILISLSSILYSNENKNVNKKEIDKKNWFIVDFKVKTKPFGGDYWYLVDKNGNMNYGYYYYLAASTPVGNVIYTRIEVRDETIEKYNGKVPEELYTKMMSGYRGGINAAVVSSVFGFIGLSSFVSSGVWMAVCYEDWKKQILGQSSTFHFETTSWKEASTKHPIVIAPFYVTIGVGSLFTLLSLGFLAITLWNFSIHREYKIKTLEKLNEIGTILSEDKKPFMKVSFDVVLN